LVDGAGGFVVFDDVHDDVVERLVLVLDLWVFGSGVGCVAEWCRWCRATGSLRMDGLFGDGLVEDGGSVGGSGAVRLDA
jgi:hypothetical protein